MVVVVVPSPLSQQVRSQPPWWGQAHVCRLPVPIRWAVYGVVVIRAGSGSLRPNEGVGGRSGVFLVVPGAERGRRGHAVPLVASGSQSAFMVALSVPMLSRSNTPFFEDVPSVLAIFYIINKQHAWDIFKQRWKF